MIEINLLPEELKLNAKKESRKLEKVQVLYLIPLVFGILIIIHICLLGIQATNKLRLNALNHKWQKSAEQRELVDDFRKEFTSLTDEGRTMQQLTAKRINWSEKLNKLSLHLPSGTWFNEISVDPKGFILRGSVVSLEKQEMALINKFMDRLKSDAGFFKDFNNLELSSVQRRIISGYDIIDFILTGELKSK